MIYATDRVFPAAKVCEAAGCKDVTFRAWRRRNGLFPELWGGRTVNHFSILDVCVVRLVVILTRHGLGADDAVAFVQGKDLLFGLELYLGRMLDEDDRGDEIVGFSFSEETPPDTKILLMEGEGTVVAARDAGPTRITYFHAGSGQATLSDTMKNNKCVATFLNVRAIVDHVLDKLGIAAPVEG
ncbi:hypothetical protein [Mesorhizobium silamurunense]|uniref:hypothetical protein n=1 Tax=Mesorhizobium silamurunense TaxID=499528 RepID=UPI0017854887|nr:hypothetical protein [Mesorhizobium silamurunense]